jgi:lipopolysaccharide transport system permease protein
MTVQADYLLVITPQGVSRRRRSWGELFGAATADLWRILFIVRSELRSRIFDKTFGLFFLAFEPIIQAGLYYVLTQVLFHSRMETLGFASIYLTVVFWRWFSKTIDNSPSTFVAYGSILRQSHFSVNAVLFSFFGVEIANFIIGLCVLVVFFGWLGITPKLSLLMLPLPMAAQFAFTVMLATICATIGAFFRDLQGMLYAFTGFWFYLSPGIYPVGNVPERFLWIYNLNPFAHLLPAYRQIVLEGVFPNPVPLLIILIGSSLLAALAFAVLKRARYYFLPYL